MESYMEMLANHAKHAAVAAAKLGTAEKNKGLCAVADELIMQQELILAENQKDLKAAEEKGVKQSLIDRLALSEKRIADMAEGPVSYTHLRAHETADRAKESSARCCGNHL